MSSIQFRLLGTVLLVTLAFGGAVSTAQSNSPSGSQVSTSSADNTAKNQRDRQGAAPTADQQKENRSDRELARQIRKSIMADRSLSTYAKNVKVIAQNGMVTLRGPVESEQEKRAIEAKAVEITGHSDHVKNEIETGTKQASQKPSAGIARHP